MQRGLARATARRGEINLAYGCSIDPNTYTYRMVDGRKIFNRVKMGRGWENWPFEPSCYERKGEDIMPRGKSPEKPSREELVAFIASTDGKNVIKKISKNYKVGEITAGKWLAEYGLTEKQTPSAAETKQCSECKLVFGTKSTIWQTNEGKPLCSDCYNEYYNEIHQQTPPEPEQAANQEPAQDEARAASTSITEWQKENDELFKDNHVPPVNMPIGCELPPRIGYTSSQYQDAIRPEDVNMDEIEPEPWETDIIARGMIENWILDVYRLDINKRLKKRLIGQLVDMEVG